MTKPTMDGFLTSIEYSDFEHTIYEFFDENIALYQLVKYCDIQKIIGDVSNGAITFKLLFNNSEEAENMKNAIQGSIVNAFNRVFQTEQHVDGASLLVTFL